MEFNYVSFVEFRDIKFYQIEFMTFKISCLIYVFFKNRKDSDNTIIKLKDIKYTFGRNNDIQFPENHNLSRDELWEVNMAITYGIDKIEDKILRKINKFKFKDNFIVTINIKDKDINEINQSDSEGVLAHLFD